MQFLVRVAVNRKEVHSTLPEAVEDDTLPVALELQSGYTGAWPREGRDPGEWGCTGSGLRPPLST